MGNRNNDQNTVYFELGDETETLPVKATKQQVGDLLHKIKKSPHCVGIKLNPAWEKLSRFNHKLKNEVLKKSCYAVNAATC